MKTTKKIFLLLAAISMVSAGALAQQKAGTNIHAILKSYAMRTCNGVR